jgi:hypothetical protein
MAAVVALGVRSALEAFGSPEPTRLRAAGFSELKRMGVNAHHCHGRLRARRRRLARGWRRVLEASEVSPVVSWRQ